jgi:multidrug efflux pump subunit AcrA (membrane-fusion protein)
MKTGGFFKIFRVLAVLIVAVGIAFFLYLLKPDAKRQVRPETGRLVEVYPVQAEQSNMILENYGTVAPRETLKLVAEVRGKVVLLHPDFKEGGFIPKDTVLIAIDPRTYQLEAKRRKVQIAKRVVELKKLNQDVINLKASIEIARSGTTLAQAEVNRLTELSRKKVLAQTRLDKAQQSYLMSLERLQGLKNKLALIDPLKEQIKTERQMAEILYQQALTDLERTRIVSPFNGWVLEKVIESGQYVNIGQYLGRIYREGAYDIEVNLPLEDLKWISTEEKMDVNVKAEIITEIKESPHRFSGVVARVKAHVDEKTRTLPVVVEVDEMSGKGAKNGWGGLKPGMFVTIRMIGKTLNDVFILPRHVLHVGDVVYIAQNGRLKIRPVHVLRRFKDRVYIDSGLSTGDRIIKTPLSEATEGMLIRIKEKTD